jgi:hypothetical protein
MDSWGYAVTWLRHYPTSRNVAGSIPDEAPDFSIDLKAGIVLGVKGGRPARRADKLTAICGSLDGLLQGQLYVML